MNMCVCNSRLGNYVTAFVSTLKKKKTKSREKGNYEREEKRERKLEDRGRQKGERTRKERGRGEHETRGGRWES